MNISHLQRLVKVVYINDQVIQTEEWTLAQCMKENVPDHVIGLLLSDQRSSVHPIINSGENGDFPVSYQLMQEYSSNVYSKSTVSKEYIGGNNG